MRKQLLVAGLTTLMVIGSAFAIPSDFHNKKRAKKTARNISKNTAIIIPEHFVPSFKPAKTFVDKVRTGNKITK